MSEMTSERPKFSKRRSVNTPHVSAHKMPANHGNALGATGPQTPEGKKTASRNAKTSTRHYKIGYGKPPEKTRFKKGQSGNPAGRPKGTPNLAAVLERALQETVVINEHGHRKVVTKLEAGAKQWANKVAAGDSRAFSQTADLLRRGEARPERETSETEAFVGADKHMQYESVPGTAFAVEHKVKDKQAATAELIETIREIYGLNYHARNRAAAVSVSVPGGLDRRSIETRDRDQG